MELLQVRSGIGNIRNLKGCFLKGVFNWAYYIMKGGEDLYKIEYGEMIYRGNHNTFGSKVFRSFGKVTAEVERMKHRFKGVPMLVERIGEEPDLLYYWEEGWFEQSLTLKETAILAIQRKNLIADTQIKFWGG